MRNCVRGWTIMEVENHFEPPVSKLWVDISVPLFSLDPHPGPTTPNICLYPCCPSQISHTWNTEWCLFLCLHFVCIRNEHTSTRPWHSPILDIHHSAITAEIQIFDLAKILCSPFSFAIVAVIRVGLVIGPAVRRPEGGFQDQSTQGLFRPAPH